MKRFHVFKSRLFSQEFEASLGDGKASWMRRRSTYIKNSSKIYFFIYKFVRFFEKKIMGLDPAPQQWLLEKKIDLYKTSKNLPQKQFSRHSLVRHPYWQKIVKTWFFLEKTKLTNCS
jgi:hypothetical protein